MLGRLSEADLDALYTACAPAAFRRARSLLGNDADAWDVVHEVFCKIAEGDLFDPLRARPMAYVHKATTNACLNHLAAQRMRKRSDAPTPVAHEGHSEALVARDLLAKLDPHLDDLDRRLLVLAFHDELPQEQIAEVLGVWRRTVGRRLARLRTLAQGLDAPPLKKTS